jgi:hypothetical protein
MAQGRKCERRGFEGAHDYTGLIGPIEVIAASLITPLKPIITRSSGWVRPETWTMIHGQRCDTAAPPSR